jgi:Flp pilus assembly protein TadD
VSKLRTFSLALALALALTVVAPQAALGRRALHESASVAGEARAAAPIAAVANVADEDAPGASDEAEAQPDDAQKPARKGNAFARALAAPFRALAKLFGGGRSKSETAKRPAAPREAAEASKATPPAEAPTRPTAEARDAVQAQPAAAAKVEPLAAPAAPVREAAEVPRAGVAEAPAARAAEGVRIVRPTEGEVARELQPKMWIPLIVGVPADPVSQGRALLQHGYIQEAIAELQTAATTSLPERLAEANNLLGLAYDRLGWHRQAAEAYERALSASPKDYVALSNLGYSLYLADDYAGALKRLKQAARLAPSEPVISNNLGVVNARLGRYGDAYKNFARGSNEYEAHVKLAGILEEQRRDQEAVRHYEAALRLQPGASAVLERLVALYERTGARDKADTARRALGQPKNPQKTATGGGG